MTTIKILAAAAFAFGLGVGLPTLLHSQTGPFQPGANPISNQAFSSAAVTPSDTTVLRPTRALYANGGSSACTIIGQLNGDTTTQSYQNVQPGEILPFQFVKVGASSTCTNIIAVF